MDEVWENIVGPRLVRGTQLRSRTGAEYRLIGFDSSSLTIQREGTKTTVKITRARVEKTAARLADGERLRFQKSPKEGGISYTVAEEIGVVWALDPIIRVTDDGYVSNHPTQGSQQAAERLRPPIAVKTPTPPNSRGATAEPAGNGFLHDVKKSTLAEGIRIPKKQHPLFQATPLPRGASDSIEITMDGHSFEGRLYHEDPKGSAREMMSFRYKSNLELLKLIGSYFPQPGGTLRVVVHSPRHVELVPEDVQAGLDEAVTKASRRSLEELREAATGRKGSAKVTTSTTKTYVRSADVIAYVVRRADGICEGCGTPAPFKKPNGDPYLEVHHIDRLAEGGPDTAENAVGLCPNCHRRAHSSSDRNKFTQLLRDKIRSH